MKRFIKRYWLFLIVLIINAGALIFYPSVGQNSAKITINNLKEMLSVVPPIFILLGLLDVWVPKEIMIKYMGENSGFKGVLLAFLLGSAAAGPLYAAFPVAQILLKKGSKFSNVLIFIGAWSTTKIPLLLFEGSSMGWNFTGIRFAINIFGIAFIAFATEKFLTKKEKEKIYANAM
jgi:uncharacterized membrane protein YraQ (UPF0718 family)